jgi:hypothetical protein
MSCCGGKRAAASGALSPRNGNTERRLAASRAAPLAAARAADVRVRYVGVRPVRVRGAASGRVYTASSADPSLTIDARDAAALIRTGLFRTAASATR